MALRNLSIVMRQKASDSGEDKREDRLRNIEAGLTRAREVCVCFHKWTNFSREN